MRYWAIRPLSAPDQVRIEKAATPMEAVALAYGANRLRSFHYKDMGTRVGVIQSDAKRIALLTAEDGWTLHAEEGHGH